MLYHSNVVARRRDVSTMGFERYLALVTRCITTAPEDVGKAVSHWFGNELVPDILQWQEFLQRHAAMTQEARRILDKALFHVERRVPDDPEEFEAMLYTALVSVRAGMDRLRRAADRDNFDQPLQTHYAEAVAYAEFLMEVDGPKSGRYWTLRETINGKKDNEAHLPVA